MDDVFSWQNASIWHATTQRLINNILPPKVLEEVRRIDLNVIFPEDLEWLEEITSRHSTLTTAQIIEQFADAFVNRFSKVRLFHGCRPREVSSYYTKGFLPPDQNLFNELIDNVFSPKNHPEITQAMMSQARNALNDEMREGKIYFVVDDVLLVQQFGHYLVYGSEYVTALARLLQEYTQKDYRSYLKRIGTPTVFACDFPIQHLDRETLHGYIINIFHETLRQSNNLVGHTRLLDYAFVFSELIRADYIQSHYHPPQIRDPLSSQIVNVSHILCDSCH